jgi:hypothetical protein
LISLKSSKVKFEWHLSYKQAFEIIQIKKVIGIELLLCYPDFNKPFHLNIDAFVLNLGIVIMQDKSK